MAGRDSFQKRQKEAARREKRQSKLDRRQGRQHTPGDSTSERNETELSGNPALSDTDAASTQPGVEGAHANNIADLRNLNVRDAGAEPLNPPAPAAREAESKPPKFTPPAEPPQTDNPPHEP